VFAIVYAVGMTAWGYGSPVPVYIAFSSVLLLALLGWVTRGPGGKQ